MQEKDNHLRHADSDIQKLNDKIKEFYDVKTKIAQYENNISVLKQ